MKQVTLIVTLQVDDFDSPISPQDADRYATQAVTNALELVGENGFSHDGADRVSVGLVEVRPFET
jgi:hypothetical protein